MTRTQFTDARRNVKKQLVSWTSIVVIGMVALVAYLSLVYSSEAIRHAASGFFDAYRLWDLEISSSLLLDEDDLAAVRAVPGVERAEPLWTAMAKLRDTEHETSVAVQTLSAEISVPELLEGRLPSAAGECAVERQLQKSLGLHVGDTLRVENPTAAGTELLHSTTFTVTGFFRHPDHISFELPEVPYLLVTRESFNLEGLNGAFMKLRLHVKDAPAYRYADAYSAAVEPVREAVLALSEERTGARERKITAVYEEEIRAGQEKLDEAKAELEHAEETLADVRRQLDEGRRELHKAELELIAIKRQLDEGARALGEAEYTLAAVPPLLRVAAEQISQAEMDILPGELTSLITQYRDGTRKYGEGRTAWYAAGEEYLDGLTLYNANLKKLQAGEEEYAAGLRKYEEGRAQYQDGLQKLREAQEQLGNVGECRWLVLDNRGNAGYVFAENQANGLSSMSYTFSSLFLVIAALVIYATVGRMVEEQRPLIGTSKALGLYNREVLAKYLFFGASAAVTAVALGVALTYFVVQRRFLSNYEPFFVLDSIPLCFKPVETAAVSLLMPLAAVVSVWFACAGLIRIPAIRLLQGEQPALRRKSSRRSSSRGLYTRLIYRNLRTDLRRVLVTIVSIAGCCLLLAAGFTIKYAIERVNDRQFGQIIRYQAEIYFDPDTEGASAGITAFLDEKGLSYALVGRYDFVFRNGGSVNSATAIVAEPESLDGIYGLTDPATGESVRPSPAGVLIPSRMSSYQGLKPGDALLAYDAALATHTIPISGVFTNHFGNLLFFTPECYARVFGTEAAQNCALVKLGDLSLESLGELRGVDGFLRIRDATADRARLDSLSSVLNAAIFLLLGLAGVMAYFIVMNLSVTYINRKTKELTIMRINGFTVRECVTYVSWDLVVTTAFGILLGLVGGHFAGLHALPVTEGPYMQFVHEPDLRTYVYSALITAGFSALISSAALRRVKYLKLSDVL